MEERKDRGVGADAEPHGKNDDQAEQRGLCKAAPGETKSCHIPYIRHGARKVPYFFMKSDTAMPNPTAITMRRTAVRPILRAVPAPPIPPKMAPTAMIRTSGQYTMRAQMK